MINSRHKHNPANQNEDLYGIVGLQKDKPSWDIECDYYLTEVVLVGTYMAGNTKFEITKYRQPHIQQKGIIIKQEWCRAVFDRMCIEDYILKGVIHYSITKPEIHTCFNATRLEMGL